MLLEFQTVATGAAGAGTRQQTAEKTEAASFEAAFLEAGQEDAEQPDLPHPEIRMDGVQPDDHDAINSPEDSGPSGVSNHLPHDADAKVEIPPAQPMNERPRPANGRPAFAEAARPPSYADETAKQKPAADQPIASARSLAMMPEGMQRDAVIDQKTGELIAPSLSRLGHGVVAASGSALDTNVATGRSRLVGSPDATAGTDLPRLGQSTHAPMAWAERDAPIPVGSSERQAELTSGLVRHQPQPPLLHHAFVLDDTIGRSADSATVLEVLPKPQKGRDAGPILTEQEGRALPSVTGKADAPIPAMRGPILDQHRAASDGLAVERAKPRSDAAKPIGQEDQSVAKVPLRPERGQEAKRQPWGAVDWPAPTTRASSKVGSDRLVNTALPTADKRQLSASLNGAEKRRVPNETKPTGPAELRPRSRDGEVRSSLTEGMSVKRIGPKPETRMHIVDAPGQARAPQGGEFAKRPPSIDGLAQNGPLPRIKITAPQQIQESNMNKSAEPGPREHSGAPLPKMQPMNQWLQTYPLVFGQNGNAALESASGFETRKAYVHPLSGVKTLKSDGGLGPGERVSKPDTRVASVDTISKFDVRPMPDKKTLQPDVHSNSSDKASKADAPVAVGTHAKDLFLQRSSRVEHHGTDRPLQTADVSTNGAQRTVVPLVEGAVSAQPANLQKHVTADTSPQEAEIRASTGPAEPGLPRTEQAQKLLAPSTTPHTNMRTIAQQVVQALPAAQNGVIEIQLRPEELGHLRIQLTQVENAMQVHVVAERGETLDLLRRHVELLQKELSTAGYSAGQFSFDRQGGQTNRASLPQPADGPDEDTVALPDGKTDAQAAPVATGLDLRL